MPIEAPTSSGLQGYIASGLQVREGGAPYIAKWNGAVWSAVG